MHKCALCRSPCLTAPRMMPETFRVGSESTVYCEVKCFPCVAVLYLSQRILMGSIGNGSVGRNTFQTRIPRIQVGYGFLCLTPPNGVRSRRTTGAYCLKPSLALCQGNMTESDRGHLTLPSSLHTSMQRHTCSMSTRTQNV